jgi:beta-phosphoglucomutase-like phosphatase (HAD superfamily)
MKAFIFDLDGTIVLSHPTHFEAYEKLFDDFGIKWDFDEFNDVFVGTGSPNIIRSVLGRNNIKDFDVKALVNKKIDYFGQINVRGGKKAIASGSSKKSIIEMLKNIGISDEFDEIVSGEEVAAPKPAPYIFIEAAKRLGVAPADCIVFEDTDFGVEAAKSAGMKCIAFTTTSDAKKLQAAGADKILKDYSEVKFEWLESF